MKTIIDIKASIISEVSIGNIRLGSTIGELKGDYKIVPIKSLNFLSSKLKYFKVENFPISLIINKYSKRIICIEALDGYIGLLLNKYKPSDSIYNLIKDSSWIYVDVLEGFISRKAPNTIIYTSLEDPDINELDKTVRIGSIQSSNISEWDFNVWNNNPRIMKDQDILKSNVNIT